MLLSALLAAYFHTAAVEVAVAVAYDDNDGNVDNVIMTTMTMTMTLTMMMMMMVMMMMMMIVLLSLTYGSLRALKNKYIHGAKWMSLPELTRLRLRNACACLLTQELYFCLRGLVFAYAGSSPKKAVLYVFNYPLTRQGKKQL